MESGLGRKFPTLQTVIKAVADLLALLRLLRKQGDQCRTKGLCAVAKRALHELGDSRTLPYTQREVPTYGLYKALDFQYGPFRLLWAHERCLPLHSHGDQPLPVFVLLDQAARDRQHGPGQLRIPLQTFQS